MLSKLMPSQQLAYDELLDKLKQAGRRKKILLLGRPQTGKSYLLQELARKNGFRYVNFTREILGDWLSERWLDSLSFQLFEAILRERVERSSRGQTILLDEVDSAVMLLTAGDRTLRQIFARQFFALDHSTPYILSTSVYSEPEMDQLMVGQAQRTVALRFTQADKMFVKERFFNNVGLFKMAEISNLRQMFKP
ncbi:MAG TPA: hypothetical protein DIW17_07655 [Clostridiales bacterium]|jgi:SpoVK/Ycf46/Vps4 family AAA+-type ATPase|uniref:ATP-binding protein n=1 Tax=Syntrophomonas wolfei TaxID=863 RepID=UPI000EE331F2|nr:ATP-binding protein [Syntrophomonas wolfei]HCS73734.1 hypothetical protein [Clostridiales bacterium]